MTDRPWISPYALAMLFRSAGRDHARTLPLKKAGDHLPPAWRLALMLTACELLLQDVADVSSRAETPFAPVLTGTTKPSDNGNGT
jgi:hypothetical protein